MVMVAKVELKGDIGDFVPKMGLAAQAVENVDDKVKDLDGSLDKIPADAAKAAAAMKLLGGDLSGIGNKFKDIGDKSVVLALINTKIKDASAEVRKLGVEFKKTGDVDVFAKLRDTSATLDALRALRNELQHVQKASADAGGGGDQGGGGGGGRPKLPKLPGGGSGGLNFQALPFNPHVAAAVGAGGLALAPLISGVTGAVLGLGAALGAIAGGVVGAVQVDPKATGDAWRAEISSIKQSWLEASGVFVKPTVDAIHTLGAAFQSIELDRIFEKASHFIQPLANGVDAFVRAFGSGLESFVDAAGPIIKELAAELPELGEAFKIAAEVISGGAEGEAQALKDLLDIIEGVIIGTGIFIRGFSDIYHGLKDFSDSTRDTIHDLRENNLLLWATLKPAEAIMDFFDPRPVDTFGEAMAGAAAQGETLVQTINGVRVETDQTASTMDDFGKVGGTTFIGLDQKARDLISTVERMNKTFNDALGKVLSLSEANIAVAENVNELTESFKKNGATTDINTEKGQANLRMINQTVGGLARQRDAAIAAGGGTKEAYDKARAAYNQHIDALEKLLVKLGMSAQAAANLTNQFRDKEVTYTIRVKVVDPGGNLAGGTRTAFAMARGGVRRAAEGLMIPPRDPGTILAGEPQTGGEALIPLQGLSQSRAMSLMQLVGSGYGLDVMRRGASGWGAGGATKMTVMLTFAGDTDGAFSSAFMKLIRDRKITISAGAIA